MKNHEGYTDKTAYYAIKRASKKNGCKKSKRLVYTLNEVKGFPTQLNEKGV